MRSPERPGEATDRLSPEARRRVLRAALLRPMSLLVVVVGGVFFALTLVWWVIPLTLATYGALALLAFRDPLFRDYVLEGRPMMRSMPSGAGGLSPEQRARRLPRGETRQKVEAALQVHQRTIVAIRESGEDARVLLDDAVPRLDLLAGRLVEVAERRERAAGELEEETRAADAEVSCALEKLLTLRGQVVRISTETGAAARKAAAKLNADLDETNLRLEALLSPKPSDR